MSILYIFFLIAFCTLFLYIGMEIGAIRERNKIFDQLITDEYYKQLIDKRSTTDAKTES